MSRFLAQLRNPNLAIGLGLVIFVLIAAGLAPWFSAFDPLAIDLENRLAPPSADHWAGTDELGRDLTSRILFGTRTTLLVAFGITAIAMVFGILVGAVAGYFGGMVDVVAMRGADVFMALPSLVIALALTSALGPSLVNLTLAIGVLGIPYFARLARGITLTLVSRPYVIYAQSIGASDWFILRVHVLPNLLSALLIYASMQMSGAMLVSSALSFIGLGAQPPAPELGALIASGRAYILDEWWYTVAPGLFLVAAAFGFNLLGDGLRDALDPRSEYNS